MICKKCGKEIADNVKYCNFCGADLKNESIKSKKNIYKILIDFFAPLGELKKWLLSIMLLLPLNTILTMCANFKYTEDITGQDIYSETASIFNDLLLEFASELPFVVFLIFVGIVSIIFAEFFMILPLLFKKEYTPKYILPAKIISIVALLFVVFVCIVILVEGKNEEAVKCSITFWGWLLIIDSIALVTLTFKSSSILKNRHKETV